MFGSTFTGGGSGGGGGYSYLNTSLVSSNITGVNGILYVVDMSGMTSNLDFNLPTPAGSNEKIKVQIKTGNNTYALILKINSTEWSRVFIKNESVEFLSTGTNPADWIIYSDGRIACNATIKNSNVQSIPHNVDTQLTLDELVEDNCGMANTSNNRLLIRRTGKYAFYCNFRFDRFAAGAGVAVGYIYENAVTIISLDEKYDAATRRPTVLMTPILFVTAGNYEYFYGYQQTGAAVNTYNVSGQAQVFSASELLS